MSWAWFAILAIIAIALWQTNQAFPAFVAALLALLLLLAESLNWTKRGAKAVGKKLKGGIQKELDAMEKAKPSAPNAGKLLGEYAGAMGKEAAKATATQEHRYIAPNLWARLGTASKNVLDGLSKWFKK